LPGEKGVSLSNISSNILLLSEIKAHKGCRKYMPLAEIGYIYFYIF